MVASSRGYANSLGVSEGQGKVIWKLNPLHENKNWLEFHFRSTFLPAHLGQNQRIMLMSSMEVGHIRFVKKGINLFLGQLKFILEDHWLRWLFCQDLMWSSAYMDTLFLGSIYAKI